MFFLKIILVIKSLAGGESRLNPEPLRLNGLIERLLSVVFSR